MNGTKDDGMAMGERTLPMETPTTAIIPLTSDMETELIAGMMGGSTRKSLFA